MCCCICKLFVDNGHEAGHAKELMWALHSVHSTTSSDYAVAMRLQVIAHFAVRPTLQASIAVLKLWCWIAVALGLPSWLRQLALGAAD
jgi:sterol desaturase/sphingolipid hydroxylase (fatty acid hydroxylase superfamily)